MPGAVEQPASARPADTGPGPGEVLVVRHGDQPIESSDAQRDVAAQQAGVVPVGATGRRQGIVDPGHPQRSGGQLGDPAGRDVAGPAEPDPVPGSDVLHAGGQPGPPLAVAEDHLDRVAIAGSSDVDLFLRTPAGEAVHLAPPDPVDAHLQGAGRAQRVVGGQPGQGTLAERESLPGLARVATADRLVAPRAVGGPRDDGVARASLTSPR